MVKIAKAKANVVAESGPSSKARGSTEVTLNISGRDWTSGELSELAGKLKSADADQTHYWIQALFGEIAEDKSDADSLAKQIIQFVNESSFGGMAKSDYDRLSDYEAGALDTNTWSNVKAVIVNQKLSYTTHTPDPKSLDPSTGNTNNPKTRVTFDYPMYEGDCVFNSNDPVRVAFRDPFDPLVWYWMFAGFVDSFTEEYSEDQESIVTLTCTDVSKVLRYSVLQTNMSSSTQAGTSRDERISDKLKALYGFEDIENYISDAGLYFTAKLFDSLTILEILDILFFGNDSTRQLIETKYTSRVADEYSQKVIEEIKASFSSVDSKGNKQEPTANNVYDYMINAMKFDPAQARDVIQSYASILDSESSTGWEKELTTSVSRNLKNLKVASLGNFNFPPLTFPGNVQMKRKSGKGFSGAYFYVLGKPDVIDETLGGEQLKSLRDWNDLIHHRVRKADLDDMYNPVKSDKRELINDLFDRRRGLKTSEYEYQEIQDVISIVGTGIMDYPVGGGRLFFLTFSQIEQATERSILDRSVGGPGSDLHSSYIDRLTLLYDLAKNIDFRFYATPKGDFVFELPFYDFDPNQFWDSNDGLKASSVKSSQMSDYESVFTEAYTGRYNEDASYKTLTGLQFLINAETGMLENTLRWLGDDSYYPYEKVFSIGKEDMISFSNTLNDQGMITVAVAKPNTIGLMSGEDAAKNLVMYQNAYAAELIPRLGVRVSVDDTWNSISTPEAAKMMANFMLNSTNSNCRNCGIQIIPRFGMMVNRPIWWRHRNQFGNVLSVDHSINWNSSASTGISVNNIRAWNGTIDSDGNYVHLRFGGETMFNWKDLIMKSGSFGSPSGNSANAQKQGNTDKTTQPTYDSDFNEVVDPESIF
jgi:hypothetical protein